jgi:hypothetical protein
VFFAWLLEMLAVAIAWTIRAAIIVAVAVATLVVAGVRALIIVVSPSRTPAESTDRDYVSTRR